ncbi:MAG TPA: hypothetical protein VGB83_08700 [Actinomycetota bacterium]
MHKGTLSTWCRDVELTDEHRARLARKRPRETARIEHGRRLRERAQARRQSIRRVAKAEADSLLDDPLWISGVVAYWAEGAKTSNQLIFANSDPDLVRLFIRWLIRFLDVHLLDLVARLHLHSGQDEAERIAYWSGITRIPAESFGKTYVKKEGTGHRKNILWAGTISVRVRRSSAPFHRVMGWIDRLREPDGHATLPRPAGR